MPKCSYSTIWNLHHRYIYIAYRHPFFFPFRVLVLAYYRGIFGKPSAGLSNWIPSIERHDADRNDVI